MNPNPQNPDEHPQDANPAQPTRATDPQAREIAGNVFEGLGDVFSPSEEDRETLKEEKPLEDLPQTGPVEE